jgi:hypothetical protein
VLDEIGIDLVCLRPLLSHFDSIALRVREGHEAEMYHLRCSPGDGLAFSVWHIFYCYHS